MGILWGMGILLMGILLFYICIYNENLKFLYIDIDLKQRIPNPQSTIPIFNTQ